jgi:hypothetical protein
MNFEVRVVEESKISNVQKITTVRYFLHLLSCLNFSQINLERFSQPFPIEKAEN